MAKILFETIKNRKLSEFIENYIKELILKGEIQPNDRLPTEKEISEQFGVSVVTVREALKGLEVFGLIEKKTGKSGGIFVREIESDSAKSALLNFLTLKQFSAQHISEMRLIVEPMAVKIAGSKITPAEISDLGTNIESCEKKLNETGSTISENDFFYIQEKSMEFHRLIAEATHNPILSLTVDYTMDFLLTFKKEILPPDIQYSIRTVDGHRSILNRLKEGDPEGGEREMLSHLKIVSEYLMEKQAEKEQISRLTA